MTVHRSACKGNRRHCRGPNLKIGNLHFMLWVGYAREKLRPVAAKLECSPKRGIGGAVALLHRFDVEFE
jgi:hypothetical protein